MNTGNLKKETCPDCGPVPVVHWVERWSIIVDWFFAPLFNCMDWLLGVLRPLLTLFPWQYLGLPFFKLLVALHLGTLQDKVDDRDNARTRAMWESAGKRGIEVKEFRLLGRQQAGFFWARWNGKGTQSADGLREGGRGNGSFPVEERASEASVENREVLKVMRPKATGVSPWSITVFEGLPRPFGLFDKSLAWMDNKSLIKKKFSAAGIPVARGGTCTRFSQAEKVFEEVGAPVIVKPHIGSRSRHTFVHVMSIPDLKVAFKSAKQLSPWVIVEEELIGHVYRGTVVGGKCLGVVSREPAHVTGDGTKTIRELVEEENKNPLRKGPIYHAIPVDEEGKRELARQGFTWDSIPKKEERVTINQKVTRTLGAVMRDVMDETHPDIISTLEKAADVLGSPLVGIDFIIKDISKSWKEQEKCGIIECNSLPFVDLHHYPISGKPRDVAGALWEMVFPGCSEKRT